MAPTGDGGWSIHATAVALGGRALAICGPAGAGKSAMAAGMIASGARLVADDLCVLRAGRKGVAVAPPPGGAGSIELRGIGLVTVAAAGPCVLAAFWIIGPSAARLPEPETVAVGDRPVRVLRHPSDAAAAAKAVLWLGAAR